MSGTQQNVDPLRLGAKCAVHVVSGYNDGTE
jgi:hypothetical protein